MNTVMLRPMDVSAPSAVSKPSGTVLLPSIHSSRKGSTVAAKPLPELGGTSIKEAKKKGRPSKAEKMKEKRARASEGIRALVDSEPSKKDVHAYFQARIKTLLDEAS